jgi:adenosylcobyric acid synthase
MFVGTASDVGKSVIAAGFCRILRQDGYRPAPFKAQNMSLNSFVTPDGLEIGRAQAVQAEAANIPCSSDMNPVLLKPNGDTHAQLVLHGKVAGNQSAYDYFMGKDKAALWEEAKTAFDRLAARYNPIVMEGAGSISELNLKKGDITNLRMAEYAKADVYLVADIDRGGVFASVYGTMALLSPEERALIKGVIINKFRGDVRLFEEGRKQIESLAGVPVVGVLPFFRDIHIEEEDSVALRHRPREHKPGAVNIAIVHLPHMANFTDFAALERTTLHVYYTDDPAELAHAKVIILPGSKNTIGDLAYIRSRGLDRAIGAAESAGVVVVGICGGFQMMGLTVADPYGVEGEPQSVEGIGLLPVHTVLAREKTTVRRRMRFLSEEGPVCEGYEIHMGQTEVNGHPLQSLTFPIYSGEKPDGYRTSPRCWGTYLHGILDNRDVVEDILRRAGVPNVHLPDYRAYKERQYDRLADHLRQHVDLTFIYKQLARSV